MTVNSRDSYGQPIIQDPPTTIADMTALAAYTSTFASRITDVAANRANFNQHFGFAPRTGLLFYEIDTDNEYKYLGGGWVGTKVQAGIVSFGAGDLTAASGGYAGSKVIQLAGGRFTALPSVTLGVFTSSADNQHAGVANVSATAFTLYYWRTNQTATTVGWTASPTDS